MGQKDLPTKARDYAFLLLKYRLRSENELRTRLKRKKFPEEVIAKTISFLKEKEFLNDALFAKSWIDARIKRPLGINRIREELKIKGVSREIIQEQLRQLKEDYREADIVKEVAAERFSRMRKLEPLAAKRRLCGYLLRRGFSPDTVYEALRQL